MKKKKLNKIAKLIFKEIKNFEQQPKKLRIKDELKRGIDWANYDQSISDKFTKMILLLTNYSNNIHLNIDHERIQISTGDITLIKKSSKLNQTYSEETHLELSIIKNIGFTINLGYKLRSNYKDEQLFNKLKPILTEKLQQINKDNFNDIWNELIKGSGIIRDNNLDEILQ